jgi:hypothetical protein
MPRGYLKDHPAARYLRYKQFLAGREFEADFATSPRFYPELLRIFRAVAPLVRFLNTPLLEGRKADLKVGLYTNVEATRNVNATRNVEAGLQTRLRRKLPAPDEALMPGQPRAGRHPQAASRW